jgi:hypothetical protein
MKCMICGGKTLPGAKLCLPCRSALRRARDDTVSELLPLPRRLDALAYQHAHTVTGTPPRASIAAKEKKARITAAKRISAGARSLPHRAWQLAVLAIAVLVLAILGGMAARQSHDAHADTRDLRPSLAPVIDTRVSPAALAAEARNSTTFSASPTLTDASAPAEPALPEMTHKERPKAEKARAAAPRPTPVADMTTALGPSIEEAGSAVPVSKPDIAIPPAPDRWQLLSGRLSGCAGGNLFARVACEHAARAQYCEGYWGQVAQCPAGIANEHGQ